MTSLGDVLMAKKPTYEELEQRVKVLEKESFELRRAEEQLGYQKRRLESLIEYSSLAIVTLDEGCKISSCNRNFEELFHFKQSDIVGRNLDELIAGHEYIEDAILYTKETLRKKAIYGSGKRQRKDGAYIDVEFIGAPIIVDGKLIGFYGIYQDVSDRKRAEEALRKSEREKSAILNAMAELVAYQDINHTVLWTNRAAAASVNEKQKNLEGRKCYEIWAGREKQCEICPVAKAIETGHIHRDKITTPDERVWIITGYPVKNETGEIIGAVEVTVDGTKREQAEQALRESQEKYRNILESIEDGYFEVDNAGNLTFFNDSLRKILGYSKDELMGINNRQYVDEENAKKLYRTFNKVYNTGKADKGFDSEIIRKDGSSRYVEASVSLRKDSEGQPIGFRGIVRDISERKLGEEEKARLEAQLRQSQKMEAIGILAGGIAHDFNNILAAIIGYTEIAGLQVPEDNKAKESLKEVLNAGRRARDLVKQILAFSRKGEQEAIPIQISHIVKEALKLIRSSLPTTIEIRQNIKSDTGIVEADPTQIHQILMNLCTNAAHAMREEGGILEVAIRNVEVGGWDSESGGLDMIPGPYLLLSVSDTGEGMTPEVLGRIFDPYFTTKEKGEGTGLGLAVVHGIVKIYGGTIRAFSEPGKGTTFHVYLPRIKEEKEMAGDVSRPGVFPTGQERVLFVDDEPVLVEIAKQMLERLGYEVTTRTSSIEALELFRTKPDQFDLVITDMTMPNMTGDKLSRELMQIRPDIPIIICTGYSERISEEKAKGMGIRVFVMKPLVMRDLANTIRNVLDKK